MKTDIKISKKRRVKQAELTEKQLEKLANEEIDRNLHALSRIVSPGSLGNLRKAFIKQFKNHYIANGGKIKK